VSEPSIVTIWPMVSLRASAKPAAAIPAPATVGITLSAIAVVRSL